MRTSKRIALWYTGVLFVITLFFAILALQTFVFNKKNITNSAAIDDFTQLTTSEQTVIDNKVLVSWGNPTTLNPLAELDANTGIDNNTDGWYYLTQNVQFSPTFAIRPIKKTHIRILLNGFKISGTALFQLFKEESQISLFDKIPNKYGTGYEYNPNPIQYFVYSYDQQQYIPTNTVPTGVDVTDMPTFTENTYIKVSGSMIAPNMLSLSNKHNASIHLLVHEFSTLNMYGVSCIALTLNNANIIDIRGTVNLYQCNFIGNISTNQFYFFYVTSAAKLKMEGCKIYGNKAIQTVNASKKYVTRDIVLSSGATFTMYKSNIGTVDTLRNTIDGSYINCIFMHNVYFKTMQSAFSVANLQNCLNTANGVSGTIELIYNVKLNCTAQNPELSLVVRGDKTTQNDTYPKIGANSVYVDSGAVLAGLSYIDTADSATINGTVNSLDSTGEIVVGATGVVTIPKDKSVASVLNQGQISFGGTIQNLIENAGTLCILQDTEFEVPEGVTIGGNVVNDGILTVRGTLNAVWGNGEVSVAETGRITIPQGTTLASLSNAGTVVVAGRVNALLSSSKALTVQNTASITVAKNTNIEGLITNYGTLLVDGTVNRIRNFAECTINTDGNVSSITNSANLTIQANAIATEINNDGSVLCGGTIQTISNANGNVTVKSNAVVNSMQHQSGQLTVENDAQVSLTLFGVQAQTNNSGTIYFKGIQNNTTTLTNQGRFILNGGSSFNMLQDTALNNAGVVQILQDATLTVAKGSHLSGTIINAGTFNVAGVVTAIAENTGAIHVDTTGELIIPLDATIGGEIDNNGQFTVHGTVSVEITNSKNGTLHVYGIVQSIENNGECILEEYANAGNIINTKSLIIKGSATAVTNREGATAQISGTIENSVRNYGNIELTGIATALQNFENATATVQGDIVDLLENRGNLIFSGSTKELQNFQNATLTAKNATIFKLVNHALQEAKLTNSNIETLENWGKIHLKGNVTTVANHGTASVETTSKDIDSIVNSRDAKLTIVGNIKTDVQNNGTLSLTGNVPNIQNNGTLTLRGDTTTIVSNGQLTVAGNVETITVQSGTAIMQSGDVQNLITEINGSITVEATATAENIENKGTCTVGSTTKSITSSGNLIVHGNVESITIQSGIATMQSGAMIEKLIAQSKLIVENGATIKEVEVQNNANGATSHTDIKDNAIVTTAKLTGDNATLEIQRSAKVDNLEYVEGIGTLIDHRTLPLPPVVADKKVSNTSLIILICSIVGGILLLIAILLIIIFIIKKKTNLQSLKNVSVKNGQFVVSGTNNGGAAVRANTSVNQKQNAIQASILEKIANLGSGKKSTTTSTAATPAAKPLPQMRTFKSKVDSNKVATATKSTSEQDVVVIESMPKTVTPAVTKPNFRTLSDLKKINQTKAAQKQEVQNKVETKSKSQSALDDLRAFLNKDKK